MPRTDRLVDLSGKQPALIDPKMASMEGYSNEEMAEMIYTMIDNDPELTTEHAPIVATILTNALIRKRNKWKGSQQVVGLINDVHWVKTSDGLQINKKSLGTVAFAVLDICKPKVWGGILPWWLVKKASKKMLSKALKRFGMI